MSYCCAIPSAVIPPCHATQDVARVLTVTDVSCCNSSGSESSPRLAFWFWILLNLDFVKFGFCWIWILLNLDFEVGVLFRTLGRPPFYFSLLFCLYPVILGFWIWFLKSIYCYMSFFHILKGKPKVGIVEKL